MRRVLLVNALIFAVLAAAAALAYYGYIATSGETSRERELALMQDLAAHHALHPTHLVLVHADDGVGRVGFASRRRTVGLDLSTHLIGVFFKDGIHPCLFLDEWLTNCNKKQSGLRISFLRNSAL